MAETVYIHQLKTDEALLLKFPLVLLTARIFSASLITNTFYITTPLFKLSPFRGNRKGKGKASDPVIVSSDSDSE